jgi:hypothetical protein
MHLRKIRLGVLGVQGLVYRCFIIGCNTIFFLIGIKSTNILGDVSFLVALKYAFGTSIAWNLINTCLYYTYHYFWSRIFKLGK